MTVRRPSYPNLQRDYRAVGNGIADDSGPITSFLTDALASGGRAEIPTGGKYLIPAGKEISITYTPNSNNINAVIEAFGSTITYPGTSTPITLQSTNSGGNPPSFEIRGGYLNAPNSTTYGWLLRDVCGSLFERHRCYVPKGSSWGYSNIVFWSERNGLTACDDSNGAGSGSASSVTFLNEGSVHLSFARTIIRDLWIQGGQPNRAKINVLNDSVCAPYDSRFDGIRGNIPLGVYVFRMGGSMEGTKISGLGVEGKAFATLRTDSGVSWPNNSATITDVLAIPSDLGQALTGVGVPDGAMVVAVTPGVSLTSSIANTSGSTVTSVSVGGYNTGAFFQLGTVGPNVATLVDGPVRAALPTQNTGTFLLHWAQGSTPWGTVNFPALSSVKSYLPAVNAYRSLSTSIAVGVSNAFGAPTLLYPDPGFIGVIPQGFQIIYAGVSGETVSVEITSTTVKGATSVITPNSTTSQTQSGNQAQQWGMAGVLDPVAIWSVRAKSSAGATAATVNIAFSGVNC